MRVENSNGAPADPPLSETGHSQARSMAHWLRDESFERIYASPLRRAFETAEPLAEKLRMEITVRDGVAEYDAQSDAYIPMEELKIIDYERWRAFMEDGYADEAEFMGFAETVITALESIVEENRGKKVAVVCHGGVINVWTAHVIGIAPRLFFDPNYTSINRYMAASSGQRTIITLNQAVHLQPN
jgi:probable phosphoglycerate mutase